MVETFENAPFQIKMTILEHIPIHFWSKLPLMTAIIINSDENHKFFVSKFANFEIFGWWKIEIVMRATFPTLVNPKLITQFCFSSILAQTRLF